MAKRLCGSYRNFDSRSHLEGRHAAVRRTNSSGLCGPQSTERKRDLDLPGLGISFKPPPLWTLASDCAPGRCSAICGFSIARTSGYSFHTKGIDCESLRSRISRPLPLYVTVLHVAEGVDGTVSRPWVLLCQLHQKRVHKYCT